MKNFLILLLLLTVCFVGYIAFSWVSDENEVTLGEQVEIVTDKVGDSLSESYEDTTVSNTANSASKLGNVLEKRLNEAQGVFEFSPEAQ